MKLKINRKKLISSKGQNLNLSFSNGYSTSKENQLRLDELIIETITDVVQPQISDNENTKEE